MFSFRSYGKIYRLLYKPGDSYTKMRFRKCKNGCRSHRKRIRVGPLQHSHEVRAIIRVPRAAAKEWDTGRLQLARLSRKIAQTTICEATIDRQAAENHIVGFIIGHYTR